MTTWFSESRNASRRHSSFSTSNLTHLVDSRFTRDAVPILTLNPTGIFAALTAALFWAVATSLYRQMSSYWTPAGLATVKSGVSTLMFLIVFAVMGVEFWDHQTDTILWLVISGVIGIAIGDTAIFYALYRMTEREALIVAETAAPIFVVLAAYTFLAETLSYAQLAGVLLVVVGVDAVLGLRRGEKFDALGIAFATLAAACQAFGMVVSRVFLTQTDITAEESAFWRLLGAVVVLPFWLLIRKESIRPAIKMNRTALWRLFVAIVLGTFLGILLLQLAVQKLPAGLAQALIVTSIIFATMIGYFRGDKITAGQWLGVGVAVAGVGLIVA